MRLLLEGFGVSETVKNYGEKWDDTPTSNETLADSQNFAQKVSSVVPRRLLTGALARPLHGPLLTFLVAQELVSASRCPLWHRY
jgi:hypothetical protein